MFAYVQSRRRLVIRSMLWSREIMLEYVWLCSYVWLCRSVHDAVHDGNSVQSVHDGNVVLWSDCVRLCSITTSFNI